MGIFYWDWIPTEISFAYYCAKDAGSYQNKTIEQWKVENPGVWDTLRMDVLPEEFLYDKTRSSNGALQRLYQLPDGTMLEASYDVAGRLNTVKLKKPDGISGYRLNQRFVWLPGRYEKRPFNVRRLESSIVDTSSNDIVTSHVNYRTRVAPIGYAASGFSDYKFWLSKSDGCSQLLDEEKKIT